MPVFFVWLMLMKFFSLLIFGWEQVLQEEFFWRV